MRLKKEEVYLAMNDVILNKTTIIERCVKRIYEVYEGDPEHLTDIYKARQYRTKYSACL